MENIILYTVCMMLVVNMVGFILVGVDKNRSLNREERVPEVYLFFVSVFFSALGVLLGMLIFHHKIRKAYFPLGIGVLLVEQVALVWLIIYSFQKI